MNQNIRSDYPPPAHFGFRAVCTICIVLFCVIIFAGCAAEVSGSDGSETVVQTNADGTVSIIINEGNGFVSTTGTKTVNERFPGYHGKFIENLGDNSNIIYMVNSSVEGAVRIQLNYAFWGNKTEIRAAYIYVNGQLENESSPLYCQWTSKDGVNAAIWQESMPVQITLRAGNNYIRVQPVPQGTLLPNAVFPEDVKESDKTTALAAGASGKLPNVDYLKITAVNKGHQLAAATNVTAYYAVKISSLNNNYGSVTYQLGENSVKAGTEITVSAAPKDGYKFDSWTGTKPSAEDTYTFVVTEDTELIARFIPESAEMPPELQGFAAVQDDFGTRYTLTGGFGGEKISVSTLEQLESALSGDKPKIILIENLITTPDDKSKAITAGSNKTIQSDTGKGHLKNIEVKLNGENYIVRNMTFSEVIAADDIGGAGNDSLKIGGGKHIWIDNCEFYSHLEPIMNDGSKYNGPTDKKDFYDGLLDITNGASFITVSNCYFHDHWKAILCGSGDSASDAQADVRIRLTLYGNYFENIGSRTPLLRYGKAHIVNNHWKADSAVLGGDTSGINARSGSEVFVENNKFEGIKKPLGFYFEVSAGAVTGKWNVTGNIYDSAADSSYAPVSSTTDWKPPYQFDARNADSLDLHEKFHASSK